MIANQLYYTLFLAIVTDIPSRRSRFPSSPVPTLAALASPRRPRVPSSGLPPSHSRFPSSSAFPSALPLSPSHHLQPILPPSFLPKGWDRWGGTDGEKQRWSLPPPQSNSVLIPSLLPTILPPALSPAFAPVPPILFPVSCIPCRASPHPIPSYPVSPALLPPIPFPASPHPLPYFPPSPSLLPLIPFPASPRPLPCFPPYLLPASPNPPSCFPPPSALLPPSLRPASPLPPPCFPPPPALLPPSLLPASPLPPSCFPPPSTLLPPSLRPASPLPPPCFPPPSALLPPSFLPASPLPPSCFPPPSTLLPPSLRPASPLPLSCFPPPSTLLPPSLHPASPLRPPCFPPPFALLPPSLRPASPLPPPCFPPPSALLPPYLLPASPNPPSCFPPPSVLLSPSLHPASHHPSPCFSALLPPPSALFPTCPPHPCLSFPALSFPSPSLLTLPLLFMPSPSPSLITFRPLVPMHVHPSMVFFHAIAMARKRKSVASSVDLCPRDLDEIPYIAWMNKQIAAGRKPAGPLPEGAPGARDTSFEAPRDVPTRGRRHADWVASSRVNDDAAFYNDDDAADSDYNECDEACDDDADSGEEQDKGMSPSEDEVDADEDADDDEDAPEEAQPASPAPRCGRASAAAGTKTAAKGGEPPRAAAKTRNLHPVKRSVWSPRKNTIFVAARWFMEDELGPLLGKQGSQYWAHLARHLEENPGGVRGVNALQKQWRNLVNMYKQIKKGEKASGKGAVCKPHWYPYMALFQNNKAVGNPYVVDGGGAAHVNVPSAATGTPTSKRPRVAETATMAAAKLVCETIKGCHSDAMSRLEGLVRAWME
ncbi:unnamed protein product [Closterium sp. NIES-64]|nr:unnamed protein product [Closterium sp. NIES-64]